MKNAGIFSAAFVVLKVLSYMIGARLKCSLCMAPPLRNLAAACLHGLKVHTSDSKILQFGTAANPPTASVDPLRPRAPHPATAGAPKLIYKMR